MNAFIVSQMISPFMMFILVMKFAMIGQFVKVIKFLIMKFENFLGDVDQTTEGDKITSLGQRYKIRT